MRLSSFVIEMLGQSARLASSDSEVLETLAQVFVDLRIDSGEADVELQVRSDCDHAYVVDIDGQQQCAAATIAAMVQECVIRLNQVAVAGCQSLALHAGGVRSGGVGMVLPGPSGSGKSTLTAGLVRAGFEYLSDEAIAIDWVTHLVQPYLKPISLDPGAYPLFSDWAPRFGADRDVAYDSQWHIAPGSLGYEPTRSPCDVGFIVFPKYSPGESTRLEPISKGTALLETCKNTFRFNAQGRRCLDHLADLVRNAACYRLQMGDLDPAVRLLASLAAEVGA